jgi:hypothetical protein
VKALLLGVLEAAAYGVRAAAAWGSVLIFIAVSAASTVGAHVPMGGVR